MVRAGTVGGACLLTAVGTLNSHTYLQMRDSVIMAAAEEPSAVVVDVSALDVPTSSAWSVFSSARWHVRVWPDIPILLVCDRPEVAARIADAGVTRHVPVHPVVESAIRSAARNVRPRRRVRAALPRQPSSLRRSRDFVATWLANWSQGNLIPTAKVIVDVLVENVLRHTDSSPVILLESTGDTATVAVQDASATSAVLHETIDGYAHRTSGLAVVSALCPAWGSTPTHQGKTVWAVLNPESRL